ncbi:MAG: xanthine dehydrogenase family protein, partial [Armatimonadetes bacterium]|nr:xanthine dehydrogenase family protein [Armatimonadota bacterium]
MSDGTARWIGRPLRRREDPKFLQGKARYVDDLVVPNMTHLVVVRSTAAHAIIRQIKSDAARAMPGVLTVLTTREIAGRLRPVVPNPVEGAQVAPAPHPILAGDRVRYVGEPVAAVLATSHAAAEDAAQAIEIDYEHLPAVVDVAGSLAARATLHDHIADNVLVRWRRSHGDVEGAFARAAQIVRQQFHIPRLAAAPIETRGALAVYDAGSDLLTVWCSSQDPHRPLAQLSHVLSRPDDRIRVIVPDVGGGFGSKGGAPPEVAVAAWLAMETGRPVKWIEDRRENIAASYQGRGIEADVALAVDAEGKITGLRARVVADLGAYLYSATPLVPVTTSMLLTGTYAIPAASVEMLGVATNKVPTGPYRGAGRPEAAYLIEQMVDLSAHALQIDPVELRRRNLITSNQFPYRNPLGFTYDSGNYARALDRACELIEYERWRQEQRTRARGGHLIGVGVTLYVERAGSQLWESAAVSVSPNGRVTAKLGSTPSGQGHETTFAQIAADVLQINPDAVTVVQGDSAVVPRGVGTFGSRSTTIGGSALLTALERVKAKANRVAGALLEAPAADIVWSDGRIHVRGAPDRALTFTEVAAAAYQPAKLPADVEMGLDAQAVFRLPGPVFPFGAYAAVVD